jgi:hypothetical protein
MFTDQSEYEQLNRLEQRATSGARWFYWIAALSLFTTFSTLSGSSWRFIISLGTTQLVDALGNVSAGDTGDVGKAIALTFDLLATAVFAALGFFAGKKHLWAYIVGMVLLFLDSLVFIQAQDWIGIAFHLLVVFWISLGFNACRKFLALQGEAEQNRAAAAAASVSEAAPAAEGT